MDGGEVFIHYQFGCVNFQAKGNLLTYCVWEYCVQLTEFVFTTDRQVHATDRVVYPTDGEVGTTDRLIFTTDRVVGTTDRVVRRTDRQSKCLQPTE